MLAAFAGFTLAAALAAMYLLEERRLQRRSADILRLKLPSLVTLERVTSAGDRDLAAAAHGRARDRDRPADRPRRQRSTRLIVATILAWLIYGRSSRCDRRAATAAHMALVGFAVVIVVRVVLAGTHF